MGRGCLEEDREGRVIWVIQLGSLIAVLEFTGGLVPKIVVKKQLKDREENLCGPC